MANETMASETLGTETPETTETPEKPEAAETAQVEAAGQAEGEGADEAPESDVEKVLCMVSKQMVPIDETIELERKKGEVLRIHSKYKRF